MWRYTSSGDLQVRLQMNDGIHQAANVTGNGCGLDGNTFPVLHQPTIERQRKGPLGCFHSGVKCGKILDQNERIAAGGVIQ